MEKNVNLSQSLQVHMKKKKMPRPSELKPLEVEVLKKEFQLESNQFCVNLYKTNNNDIGAKVNNLTEDKVNKMPIWKRKRKAVIIVSIAVLCFVLGLAVPFIAKVLLASDNNNDYNKRVSTLSYKRFDFKLDEVLNDVFISVKTTKRFHHPRLVILIETWVSLVKKQVS